MEQPSPSTDAVLGIHQGRVLVAEDDEASRALTTEVLRRAGYEAVAVTDGMQALDVLADGTIDLALLDIGLPGVDGLAITRQVRTDRRFASLGILLLTGRAADADVVTGLDSGANDYIAKPVQPAVLLARVRSAMRTRRALLGIEAAHGVVAALANAIEAKDTSTERHSRRLGTYAAALGHGLGLDQADLHAVTYGALLHDIGKIGVPETVLLKPGPLDEREWELMRSHTEIGERIAAPLVGSDRFGPIIRHHHERWDGSGYPDGIRGEDIPLGARIVGIIDAFDAMTRARVYRHARTLAVAMDELHRGRGRQFDPQLTLAFLDLVERIGILEEPSPGAPELALPGGPHGPSSSGSAHEDA
jgi:putative two-component system response regulator